MSERYAHAIKVTTDFFDQLKSGAKTFEARKADRDYQAGDEVYLLEWHDGAFTGHVVHGRIGFLLTSVNHVAVAPGYVVFSVIGAKSYKHEGLIRLEVESLNDNPGKRGDAHMPDSPQVCVRGGKLCGCSANDRSNCERFG